MTCSCGCDVPHVIMTRKTDDGLSVCLWSDGSITDRLGNYFLNRRKISNIDVARVAMEEVCLETRSSVGDLAEAAVRVCRSKIREPGEVRRAMDRLRRTGRVRPGTYITGA